MIYVLSYWDSDDGTRSLGVYDDLKIAKHEAALQETGLTWIRDGSRWVAEISQYYGYLIRGFRLNVRARQP